MLRRTNARIVIRWRGRKKKRLSATLKVPARASLPQGERRVRGGRLESATGNLPNRFGHPENTSTSRFLKKDDQSKSNKQRILNADGNGDSTEMAPLFFETQSFEVVISNEMAEGFSRAMGGRLYINILDTAFTGGSGVELARRTRAFAPMPTPGFYLAKALPAEVLEAAEAV
jgi:hypothetical protein